MTITKGFNELSSQLQKIAGKAIDAQVSVGYTQSYALYVHENLEARHAPGKRAKFLESPARQYKLILVTMVRAEYRKTHNMARSLLRAGTWLFRKSQQIVPVDTGALKASGFVKLEKGIK